MISALLALHALVEGGIQIRSGVAHGQRAFLDGSGSHIRRCPAEWTRLTCRLHALRSVRSPRARLAFSLDGQLLSRVALVAALLARHRLAGPCGLAKAAQQTREATLAGLIEPMAAAATKPSTVVVVLAGWATLLAVSCTSGARANRHARSTGYHRARAAFQLTRFTLVRTNWARDAFLRCLVVVRSNCARDCKV